VPVQAVTPWDALADAYERLRGAERGGGDVGAALADVVRCKESCGALGSLLLKYAIETGGFEVQRVLRAAFGEVLGATWDEAAGASSLALQTSNDVQTLRDELNELREQVARLTPGVGMGR